MTSIISHNYKIIAALTFYLEKDLCSKNKHSHFKYNLFMKTKLKINLTRLTRRERHINIVHKSAIIFDLRSTALTTAPWRTG